MKTSENQNSRRTFLKKAVLGTAAVTSAPAVLARSYKQSLLLDPRSYAPASFSANDNINLALIGTGIQGSNDTITALRVPGVKLVATCDLYDGRHARAKELWGDDIYTTRDYREILDRKDVDAVIIATPDHWHRRISMDALKAGKAVYCEKPMVQKFEEGHEVIEAQKESRKVMQVGSQGMSSLGNEKAKML